MSLRKIGLASNTFDNILQMTVDCLFGGVDIAIFQSLDDLCMLGQSIVDASLQRVVDGFEGITFIPESLQNLNGVVAAGELTDPGVKLAVQLHKFLRIIGKIEHS